MERWSVTRSSGGGRSQVPSRHVDLQFDVPAGLPGTALAAARPVFWELDVHLDMPGLDFTETYLVPLYDGAVLPPGA
jgi:hypothetical protein